MGFSEEYKKSMNAFSELDKITGVTGEGSESISAVMKFVIFASIVIFGLTATLPLLVLRKNFGSRFILILAVCRA